MYNKFNKFYIIILLMNIFLFFPILLLLHCLFIFLFKRWLGPIGTFYSSIFIFFLSIFIIFNELIIIVMQGNYYFLDFGRWFICLNFIDSNLVFCMDGLALISSLLVLVLTSLALYFGIEYMFRDAFINRLLYLLNMFATSVILLFVVYDFFLILIAWEGIGLFSFLLVNFYSTRIYTIKAALKTFIFSRVSDMFLFWSFILTILVFNSTDLSIIFLEIPFFLFYNLNFNYYSIHFLTFFALTIVLSGVIKAAQFFFHVWLPDAMEAPTPASALIHSSTLVVAGVYLVIRFAILFEFTPCVNYFLALLGAFTIAFGAVTAVFQNDIKKLVAYSTISQIGYLVCGCGFCCYEEVLIYLIIHALNKAFLFILVGYLVHYFNANTDMRQMGGVYLYSFDIAVFLFGVSFNLAGLPYSAGFYAKEFLLFQIFKDDILALIVRSCWLISFFFTPTYMLLLVFIVIYGLKKSTLNNYKNTWNSLIINNIILLNLFNKNLNISLFNIRYQFTQITARSTTLILFLFWLFFFFFGEWLLLLLFNFNTLTDIINSSYFFIIKNNNVFNFFLVSYYTSNTILLYIIIFTTWAVLKLINLKFYFLYDLLFYNLNFNYILFLLIIIFFCFLNYYSFIFILLLLLILY